MNRCQFCQRTFRSPHSFAAHCRHCVPYQERKSASADHNTAKASKARPPEVSRENSPNRAGPVPPMAMQAATMAIESALAQLSASQVDYAREGLLQRARMQVVDGFYRMGPGDVTPEMRSAAKVAITDELKKWPLETLPWQEIVMRAEATRDQMWEPYWAAQKEERIQEGERDARRRETQLEDLERLRRRTRRRAVLMEQGLYEAQDAATKGGFPPAVREVVLVEIRARLEATLTGDETAKEARDAINAMVLPPLLEWTRRLNAKREAQRNQQWEHLLSLSLPLVGAALPWVEHKFVESVCDWLGLKKSFHKEAGPQSPDMASPASPQHPGPVQTQSMPASSPQSGAQNHNDHHTTNTTDSQESEGPIKAA